MSALFRLLDAIFDGPEEGAPRSGGSGDGRFMILLGCVAILIVSSVIGAVILLGRDNSILEAEAAQAMEAELWNDLLSDLSVCGLERTAPRLTTDDLRTLALFAAARFNCPEVVLHLLSVGVNIEAQRFINGRPQTVEEYAREFNAISVLEILSAEGERRRQEAGALKALPVAVKKAEKSDNSFADGNQRHMQTLKAILAEHAALRKSIHYDRARIECELLRQRLGYQVTSFDLVSCLRKNIRQRRSERREQGHMVPP